MGINIGLLSLVVGILLVLGSQNWLVLFALICGVFVGIGFTRDLWEGKLASERLLRRMGRISDTYDRVLEDKKSH